MQLKKSIKGEANMTESLETIFENLYLNKVPNQWKIQSN